MCHLYHSIQVLCSRLSTLRPCVTGSISPHLLSTLLWTNTDAPQMWSDLTTPVRSATMSVLSLISNRPHGWHILTCDQLHLMVLCSVPNWSWASLAGFTGDSVVKNLPTNAGDTGLIPGSGRSPGEGNGNPIQYSFPGNPMDRWAWRATVHGIAKS